MNQDTGNAGIYHPQKPRKFGSQWNLEDLARDILGDLIEERGLSLAEIARGTGESASNVSRFLGGVYGPNDEPRDFHIRLGFLSQVCAWLDETPMEFFARHPALRLGDDLKRQRTHARLAELLLPAEASSLLGLLRDARRLGVLDLVIEQTETLLEVAKRSDVAGRTVTRSG